MINKQERGLELAKHISEKLKPLDEYARPTRASGASTEIADVQNELFFIECKATDKKSITIQQKVWYKLIASLPIDTEKIPLYILENKDKDRFVVLDCEDFFNIIYQLKEVLYGKKEKRI